MFVVSDNTGKFNADRNQVVSVLHSMNEPMIAAADRPVEETQAFVVISTAGAAKVVAHVVLFLKASKVRVVYEWDEGPVEVGRRAELEDEALDFVENMGFMMDNFGLEKMPTKQRDQALIELPIFEKQKATLLSGDTMAKLDSLENSDEIPLVELEEEFERSPGGADLLSEDSQADLLKMASLTELEEVSDSFQAPTPAKTVFEPKAAATRKDDSGDVPLIDSEFERSEGDFDKELDSVVSMLDVAPEAEVNPEIRSKVPGVTPKVHDSQDPWIRLLASF